MFSNAIARLQETKAEAVAMRIIGDGPNAHIVIYDRLPDAKGKGKVGDQKQEEQSRYPTYTVFRIKDSYYAMDENTPLGHGAFGIVYDLFQINALTGEKDESAPRFVAKVPTERGIKDLEYLEYITKKFEQEAKITNRFYRAKFLTTTNNLPVIAMEYIEGKPVFSNRGEPHLVLRQLLETGKHPLLAKFSVFEILNHIICQYYTWLNIIHHESPKRGKALIHGDPNETNIHLFYNVKKQQLEVYFLDFGTALELENENEMHKTGINGVVSHLLPPEAIHAIDESNVDSDHTGTVGTVSDVFQIALLSLRTLKGKDRGSDKRLKKIDSDTPGKKVVKNALHNAKVPCDTAGFLDGIEVPELKFGEQHFDLSEIMHNFIQYTLSLNYQSRATTEEALNFHLTVDNLCKLLKKNPANKEERIAFAKEKLVYIAKLCVLSQGLWRTKIGEKLVDQHSYKNENIHVQLGAHVVDKTFADFEFEPKQCVAILKAYQNKTLTENGELKAIKVKEEKKFKSELGESAVRAKLNDIFNDSRENLNERLNDDHLEMILDVSLAGIHDYQKRNGSHLSFWQQMLDDGNRGKVRAENYKKIFENENYSLFTRMVVLYALLASHDGKTLQKDIAKSFQLLFKRDFRIEDLKPVILDIIRINKNENVTMAAIDCHIGQIVRKLDTKSIPSDEVLLEIESLGKAVPQSLHSRSRTL